MLDGIDRVDAVEYVLDGIVDGVLARFDGKALVPHILKGYDLLANLVLGELFPCDMLVFEVIRAVNAAVHAVIGKIERSEYDDPVAVKGELDLLRDLEHTVYAFGVLAGEQHACLAVGEPAAEAAVPLLNGARLFENGVDELIVVLVFLGITEGLPDLSVVDEFLCL